MGKDRLLRNPELTVAIPSDSCPCGWRVGGQKRASCRWEKGHKLVLGSEEVAGLHGPGSSFLCHPLWMRYSFRDAKRRPPPNLGIGPLDATRTLRQTMGLDPGLTFAGGLHAFCRFVRAARASEF